MTRPSRRTIGRRGNTVVQVGVIAVLLTTAAIAVTRITTHPGGPKPTAAQTRSDKTPAGPTVQASATRRPALPAAPRPSTSSDESGLSRTGPIESAYPGQVIQFLDIVSDSGPALEIHHPNVVVRNVRITHRNGHGIAASGAANLRIENVEVIHAGAPKAGKNPGQVNNIDIDASPGVTITNVRLFRGSTGILLHRSPDARISFVEGYDFRGPLPRGQLVQFDKSDRCVLEDFSVHNPPETSFPEDNVSVFESSDCEIRRGRVDGNNSPYGVGVIFELSDGHTGGLVEDVDVTAVANGCFSVVFGHDVTFRRVGCRDTVCVARGGAPPSSNSLAVAAWKGAPPLHARLENSRYDALCNPKNLVWDAANFDVIEFRQENFTPRPFIRLRFPWDEARSSGRRQP